MRVAVVLEQLLSPVPGGTGRYSTELAAALARRPGIDVRGYVAWRRSVAGAAVPGVTGPRRLPLGRRALIAAWERGLPPFPRDGDVVHSPTLLSPARRGVPLVVTIHDAVPWTHPETLTDRGVRWHRGMAARVARQADVVVVPTRAVERELHRHLALRRVEVVGEGVAPSFATPGRLPEGLDLPGDGYLVTLATMEPRKGLDVLVRALAEPGAPDLPLLVVGQQGWGRVDPAGMAADLGLPAGRVRVLGRLPDRALVPVLAGATALVVPSRAEGFGLPVLEGMSLGVPVVTSDDPALVEVGGGAAVAVPIGDPAALAATLREVVADSGRRAAMSEAGRRRAATQTWDAAAARLVDVYAELVG